MTLALFRWTASAALAAAAVAVTQEPRDVPTFSSKVELVTADAVVVDEKDRPVHGLRAEDFVLFEDGKAQTIASFEAFDSDDAIEAPKPAVLRGPMADNLRPLPRAARSFVLLVDDMSLAPTRQDVARGAIRRFLEVGLRDGDELIFATTSGDVWWTTRIPDGREDLEALADRVRGRSLGDTGSDVMSEWEAYRITRIENASGADRESAGTAPATQGPPSGSPPPPSLPPGASITERVVQRYFARRVCVPLSDLTVSMCYSHARARAQQVDQRRVNRTRDALAAVDRAVFALTGARGRKALLLLTEGFLNDADLGLVQEVAGRCREANLVVYSLDVRGLMTGLAGADEPSPPNSAELGLMQMESTEFAAAGSVGLAEDTGGFAVRNTNDLAAGAARVAEESRTYYLLGYAPPEGKGPRRLATTQGRGEAPGPQGRPAGDGAPPRLPSEVALRARKGYTLRSTAEIARARSPPLMTGTTSLCVPWPTLSNPAPTARCGTASRSRSTRAAGRPGPLSHGRERARRCLANLAGEERARSVLTFQCRSHPPR